METTLYKEISIETHVNVPIHRCWQLWTRPIHIMRWNHASEDWTTTWVENDVMLGGRFLWRMEARDGSEGFDFSGVYDEIRPQELITARLDDGRNIRITFRSEGDSVHITEVFEPEVQNPEEMQREGWQAILDNFRKFAEAYRDFEVLHYEITISRDPETVYRKMIFNPGYSEWTSAFNPTSRYEGTWEKRSEIRFIGNDENGAEAGMYSRIREHIPARFVSIEYLGELKNGKPVQDSAGWAGSLENYSFRESNGGTVVSVDVDTNQQFAGYFQDTWPKALQKLKEICEKGG